MYERINYHGPLLQADGSKGQLGTLAEEFLNARVPTEAQFTDHLLESRLVGACKGQVFTFHIQM